MNNIFRRVNPGQVNPERQDDRSEFEEDALEDVNPSAGPPLGSSTTFGLGGRRYSGSLFANPPTGPSSSSGRGDKDFSGASFANVRADPSTSFSQADGCSGFPCSHSSNPQPTREDYLEQLRQVNVRIAELQGQNENLNQQVTGLQKQFVSAKKENWRLGLDYVALKALLDEENQKETEKLEQLLKIYVLNSVDTLQEIQDRLKIKLDRLFETTEELKTLAREAPKKIDKAFDAFKAKMKENNPWTKLGDSTSQASSVSASASQGGYQGNSTGVSAASTSTSQGGCQKDSGGVGASSSASTSTSQGGSK